MVGIAAKRRIAPGDVRGIYPRRATAAERGNPMISDALTCKRTEQGLLRVLGLASQTRKAPHVGDRLELVAREQPEKRFQRPRRMSYGPDRRVHPRFVPQSSGPPTNPLCSVNLVQHRALMHDDVIGLVALGLVLGLILAGMAGMPFVLRIARVDLDDSPAHMSRFGISVNMIADFKLAAHALTPPPPRRVGPCRAQARAAQTPPSSESTGNRVTGIRVRGRRDAAGRRVRARAASAPGSSRFRRTGAGAA